MQSKRVPCVPDRQDVIWIDCNAQAGQEVRDVKAHPLKKLSNALFVQVCERLNQIICLNQVK